MYNTEKYIGALLESIFAQTFQDFEVIVIDDGSTDNSCAIVENYIPKFNGRLKLNLLGINTGGPAPARNKAVSMSRGKYVFCIDSDDLVSSRAFETLYYFAEKYQAELIIMDRIFQFKSSNIAFPKPEDLSVQPAQPFIVNAPTLESENTVEKMTKFAQFQIGVTPWHKFVLRDLLTENDIYFPVIKTMEDVIWSLKLFYFAKRILTLPVPLYICRPNEYSTTSKKRPLNEKLNFFFDSSAEALKILDDFFNSQKFFQENPQIQWALLQLIETIPLRFFSKDVQSIPPQEFVNILKMEFPKIFGETGNFISYIYSSSTISKIHNSILSRRVMELENKLKQLQGD